MFYLKENDGSSLRSLQYDFLDLWDPKIPIVFQQFIDHSEYYKIYYIENDFYSIRKNSCLEPGYFDSQKSSSKVNGDYQGSHIETALNSLFSLLGKEIQREFGLSLFGVDIILEGSNCYLLDLNYFPSYRNINANGKNGIDLLTDFIIHKL